MTDKIQNALFEIDMLALDVELIGLRAETIELDAGGHDHAACSYCERVMHVMDLNGRGVCERCEMEG